MTPFSINLPLLLLCTLCALLLSSGGAAQEAQEAKQNATQSCPEAIALQDITPQMCCGSFLEIHSAIIDCMAKPSRTTSTSCIAHCMLQNFHTRKLLVGTTVPMSQLILVGPKLIAHYDRCHSDLFEYFISSVFEGDFRRVVCDERLNRFLECMVKSWFEECAGYDDANPKCVELQKAVKSSTCSIRSFFAKPETV